VHQLTINVTVSKTIPQEGSVAMRGRLTRREFLQTGLSGSLVLASGVTPGFSYTRTNLSSNERALSETGFSQKDREILRAAIDEIIPAGDGMPAAGDVGAIEYLDQLIHEIPNLRQAFEKTLAVVKQISLKRFQKDFASLSREQRISVLRDLERQSSQDVFPVLRDSVYEAYYTQPRIWKLIGYDFHATNQHGPQMKSFDEILLAEVRKRPKLYREVE
jgi:Gluconate 2-dehydrogenase subunit 3